ncbi:MAG: hypothetical protein KAJ40_02865 [Alphaproteobacteria bacterium]|nr:hypothetical protein [Alphaproteobacteria bacterium]
MNVLRFFFAFCVFPLFAIFSYTMPVLAGDDVCYTLAESEAEQGIRIHSELMVIGLNCAHMADANGNNLYMEHKKFTAKHEELFATYEKIIMNYLQRNGNKSPEKALHSMRTQFANKISNDVATMRPDIFCKTYVQRIEKASKMDDGTLRKWAATKFPGHPVGQPLCKEE